MTGSNTRSCGEGQAAGMVAAVTLALAAAVCPAGAARGQVIYEPVRSQYPVGDCSAVTFDYGGGDLSLLRFAVDANRREAARRDRAYQVSADAGTTWAPPYAPVNPRTAVYVDAEGRRDAADAGYSTADARNAATAGAPRYFRKRDLLRAAVATAGAWVVPARAQSDPASRGDGTAPRHAAAGPADAGFILIIPRDRAPRTPTRSAPAVARASQ